ncbi:DUF4124 domain-containing protein [Dechloromonas denitrificans]|uniref:DUF4124 domain-containing protein n=1 Tax=Dechloromonas denitrificans TaxID=281362 RepID=UPI001CF8CB1C|nr:DUF4124 domain-containing protein [Dechloromonas denitrificans]UCV03682.1 DUF4124 domain-containing protein [Dechloromonas denitrificans]
MNRFVCLSLLSLFLFALNVQADTYKCTQGGKTVFSDTPCMAGAGRVDDQADQINRSQKRQAELVHEKNRTQLSDLEYRAARDRNVKGGYNVIDSMHPGDAPQIRRR